MLCTRIITVTTAKNSGETEAGTALMPLPALPVSCLSNASNGTYQACASHPSVPACSLFMTYITAGHPQGHRLSSLSGTFIQPASNHLSSQPAVILLPSPSALTHEFCLGWMIPLHNLQHLGLLWRHHGTPRISKLMDG